MNGEIAGKYNFFYSPFTIYHSQLIKIDPDFREEKVISATRSVIAD